MLICNQYHKSSVDKHLEKCSICCLCYKWMGPTYLKVCLYFRSLFRTCCSFSGKDWSAVTFSFPVCMPTPLTTTLLLVLKRTGSRAKMSIVGMDIVSKDKVIGQGNISYRDTYGTYRTGTGLYTGQNTKHHTFPHQTTFRQNKYCSQDMTIWSWPGTREIAKSGDMELDNSTTQ